MASNKNTKWIVIGSVILVLAILIAFGPILVTKYMRAKWENTNHYKFNEMLMNITGELSVSKDNIFYLKGDNNLYYVLENMNQEISDRVGQHCSVLGKVRTPKNNETIDNNSVRLFVGVNKIVFDNKDIVYTDKKEADVDNDSLKDKVIKKAKLRAEINAKLNTPVMFDVVVGTVASSERLGNDGSKYVVYVLTDEFNDKYALYKKNVDLSVLEGKKVACLGREILPPNNMPFVVDELTFEIYEIYDANYKKLI